MANEEVDDYKDDNNIWLMKGDCLERMKEIPDGSISMVLTDPPYQIISTGGGMMGKGGRKFISEIDNMGMCDSQLEIETVLDSLVDIFNDKQQFCGIFFCSLQQLHRYISWSRNNNYQYGVGVWHKTNPPPLCNNKYLGDVEYWLYIKGNKTKILGTYATKSMVYSSSINISDKKLYDHPTIKPIELMEKFVINHTNDGDTIFDPFMGTGSSGVAAKINNRNFIGIELSDKHFKTSVTRINGNKNLIADDDY